MEVTNGEVKVDLPESLAKLLIENRDWEKAKGRKRAAAAPVEADGVADRNTPDVGGDDDAPIPMTHIPGVVPGVSMARVKKMVANREVDVYVEGRTKKIKPSDVQAALERER